MWLIVKQNQPDEISAEVVKNLLLRKLARAPQSRAGLVAYLQKREIPAEVFEPILDRFEAIKLIDDAEFAAMWVRSRRQIRGSGPAALRRELQQKGIAPNLIEQAVAERIGGDFETALNLAERKLRTLSRYPVEKQRQRLLDFLVRRGYNFGIAHNCVRELQIGQEDEIERGY